MIPAHLYSTYLFYEYAVATGGWQAWTKFAAFVVHGFTVFGYQFGNGTDAMYFMFEDPKHADYELYPSIFYLLNWLDHNPRLHQDDNYYYDDYYY